MYDMDLRQYDPAIARWVAHDPVTHHSQSPYNAFDSNPAFWADPSGADSIMGNDIFGNSRYNDNGLYMPLSNRQNGGFLKRDSGMRSDMGGIVVSSDQMGSWIRYKMQAETYGKDNGSTALEGFSIKQWYEYEFVPNDGPSGFDLINGAIGSYLSALDQYAIANSKYIYKYGTRALSATALTQANAARMLGISRNAQIFGNFLGIVTGAYTLTKTINKQIDTGEVDVKGYLDGSIGLVGGTAGSIVTFGLIANPVGLAVCGTVAAVAAVYGIGSFIYDVYNANNE